ncbi:MAG TPA: ABC transporter permease [Vicinamibacterales bacterium]|jgi:putative ABC transport system permease protein|nr:ABC transporter permease [Vicinamibacterales bacterium]
MGDLRLGLRNLIRRPAFAIVAVVTLALGIGANAAVFTVSSAVLLAPLPYDNPRDVVVLNERTRQFAALSVTRYNYDDWRQRAKSFSGFAAFRPTNMTLTGGGDPERVPVKMLTATLLPLLGVTPLHGRGFGDADDRPGAEAVALVSAGLAERRFPGIEAVGRTLQLDNRVYTVVGILPPSFELFQPADVYVPFGPWAATLPEDRGWHPGIFPVARLRSGVSLEQARVEMDSLAQQLESEFPESNRNVRVLVTRAQDQVVQNVRPALLMLTGAVGLVLLIACANVANLLLARAVDRQKEISVRIALGASRFRIVRQLVVESLVMACIGGAAGLILAAWSVPFLTSAAGPGLPRAQNVAVDWHVALFGLGLSVLTGLVFGIVPALQATRTDIRESLNQEGRGGSGSGRHRRLRSVLVVAEIGLALVLLVGAGLLLRSFATLTRVSPGFNAENLLIVNLPLSPKVYGDSAVRTATVERILVRVKALPGVSSAAVTTMLPMAGAGATIHFNRAAYPPKGPDDYAMAGYRAATPEYLSVLGVPLRRGRLLTDRDREGSPHVVVVNESMARTYFPDRDPLGQRIQLGTEPSPDFPTMEVVGVVGDVKQSFDAGSKAEMFVPYGQFPDPVLAGMYLNTVLVVRTVHDPELVTSSVRAVLHEIDPNQPLVNIRTMRTAMAGTVAQPRFQMTLLIIFGAVAVALAAIGVYGVMAYAVSQRTAEIGVRIAVGASPSRVIGMVVWEGAKLALIGMAVGLVGAALASGAVQSLLYEVRGLDPLTFAIAPIVLGLAALVASYIPARRAARISPMAALGR